MKTTIDSAGRIVVPKPLRESLGWGSGREVEVRERDGRLEIEAVPTPMTLKQRGKVRVAVPAKELPPLTDESGGRAWLTSRAQVSATGAHSRVALLQFTDNQRQRQLAETVSLAALATSGDSHAEAKSEGWDGTIRVAAGNDPIGTNWAQAVSTMLQAAGMQVTVDTSTDTQGVVAKVLVQRDWDIATWALGWLDEHDVNYLQLIGSFNTQNPRYGATSPQLEAAIDKLRTAETQDDRVEAYGEVTEAWFDVMPVPPCRTADARTCPAPGPA